MQNLKNTAYLVYSDLYRYHGRFSVLILLRELFWGIGFKYMFWLRICRYFKFKSVFFYPCFLFCWLMVRRYMFKFGIQIDYLAQIGPGFYIGHFGNIIVNSKAVIGKNCNISPGVTIGQINRGEKKGVPVLGDNVFIAPGAKILGNIKIGNNAAIGANAVVINDVQDNEVVAGIPAKVISNVGSEGYINRTDY